MAVKIEGSLGITLPDNTNVVDRVASLPVTTSAVALTAIAAHKGALLSVTNNYTINTGTFNPGDTVTLFNNSTTTVSINAGTGVTFRSFNNTNTTTRSLLGYGVASILCVAANVYAVNGAGVA